VVDPWGRRELSLPPDGLRNLLPDIILGLQTTLKLAAAAALPRTPLGELIALPQIPLLVGMGSQKAAPPPKKSHHPL